MNLKMQPTFGVEYMSLMYWGNSVNMKYTILWPIWGRYGLLEILTFMFTGLVHELYITYDIITDGEKRIISIRRLAIMNKYEGSYQPPSVILLVAGQCRGWGREEKKIQHIYGHSALYSWCFHCKYFEWSYSARL